MDLDQSDDTCSLAIPSYSTGYGSCTSSGDKYLTVRRHTVGPGDSAHEQVHLFSFDIKLFYNYKYLTLLALLPFKVDSKNDWV